MGAPAVSAHPLPSGAIRTILLVLFSSVFRLLCEMEEGKRLPEDDDAIENIERFLREKNEEKKETNNGVNLHLLN
jgi:hypothetical protein